MIIPLTAKKETQEEVSSDRVWECKCGHAQFFLHEDQSVECAECGLYSSNVKTFFDEDFRGPSKGNLDH